MYNPCIMIYVVHLNEFIIVYMIYYRPATKPGASHVASRRISPRPQVAQREESRNFGRPGESQGSGLRHDWGHGKTRGKPRKIQRKMVILPRNHRDLLVGGDWNMTCIFPYIGNNHPNWLICFRWVETTNQTISYGFHCFQLGYIALYGTPPSGMFDCFYGPCRTESQVNWTRLNCRICAGDSELSLLIGKLQHDGPSGKLA